MKRVLSAALLAASLLIVAAPAPVPTGSISIAAGSDLSYQGEVTFDTSVGGLKGQQYPMVYVECSQGVVVYGQLDFPGAIFTLGGGSSDWVENGGGEADCQASLFAYGGKSKGIDTIVLLAGPLAFHAEA